MTNGIRFEILRSPSPVSGRPLYVSNDYAFNFQMDPVEWREHVGVQGTTSFLVGTLQLEVAVHSSLCLYIWGYCPMCGWERIRMSPPRPQHGSLRAIPDPDDPLIPGVSVELEDVMPTPWFDPTSGWFCMGNHNSPTGAQAVQFATGCVAVVSADGGLWSLWVRPENWKELGSQFLEG